MFHNSDSRLPNITSRMPSTQIAQRFAKQPHRRSESQNPIMGISSEDVYRRNKHNSRTSAMSNLAAIKQLFPSKKNSKAISRWKQYQSAEFALDSSVDKYSQLHDKENENDKSRKGKTHKKKQKRGSNSTQKTLDSVSEHSPTRNFFTAKQERSEHSVDYEDTLKTKPWTKMQPWIQRVAVGSRCILVIYPAPLPTSLSL